MQNKKDLLPLRFLLILNFNFKFIPQHTIKSCNEYTSLIININNYKFSCLKHLTALANHGIDWFHLSFMHITLFLDTVPQLKSMNK